MALIHSILHSLGIQRSTLPFKTGDHVEHVKTRQLMIVEWAKAGPDNEICQVCCKWFDREQKVTKTQVFLHPELKTFDWYQTG